MRLILLTFSLFLSSIGTLAAQSATAIPSTCGSPMGNESAPGLLTKTLHRPAGGGGAALLANSRAEITGLTSSERPLGSIVAGSDIAIRVQRPLSITPEMWTQAYIFGAAETERRITSESKETAKASGFLATLHERSSEELVARLKTPDAANVFIPENWSIVVVVCGSNDAILAYTNTKIMVWPGKTVLLITLAALAIFWLAISWCAWEINSSKLHRMWQDHCTENHILEPTYLRMTLWKILQAANPIFIAQDSLGYGSLARVQILFFTTVVGSVLFYIFIHSGELTSVSNTILILLGIMVVGGTFGRATSDWFGLTSATRRVLLGEGLITKQLEKPRFSDLLETQGEIDVAKVQAMMFTVIVAMSIVAKGYGGLNAFELPEQFIYLLGISQSAYVLGKFVPTDVKQRIEQDFQQLRMASENLLKDSENTQLKNSFLQARNSASATLKEVFLERFKEGQFATMGADRFAAILPQAAPPALPQK